VIENIQKTTLPNGVRVVTEHIPTVASVSVGIWVATGSRHEPDHRRGISHFLEHMLFKGTERRPTAKDIADEMDNVGGYLNAFTDKEYTCYYARALSEHFGLALDILTDMFAHSRFDTEETHRERKVVLEEIKRRDDDPEDLIHDVFAETMYPHHPLGLPVIGTAEIVGALEPDDLRHYMTEFYTPERVIIAAAGNLKHQEAVAITEKALGHLTGTSPHKPISLPPPAMAQRVHEKPSEQVNFCIGVRGFGQFDQERYALGVLDTVLGGSMGARLFQEIREKRGLAYSVGSYAAMHAEGGYFAAYGGTSPDTYEECVALVLAEFEKVRREGISTEEINRAKNQFRGALVMAQESLSSRMNRIGKSEVYHGTVVPLDDVLTRVNAVTMADVQAVAETIFPATPDELTITAMGPFSEGDNE
jgi:predicted Zn-dependent peptidase